MKARNSAVSQLIENHKEEYARLYGDAREAAGLPRDPETAAKNARIEKLREQLKALGYEGTV